MERRGTTNVFALSDPWTNPHHSPVREFAKTALDFAFQRPAVFSACGSLCAFVRTVLKLNILTFPPLNLIPEPSNSPQFTTSSCPRDPCQKNPKVKTFSLVTFNNAVLYYKWRCSMRFSCILGGSSEEVNALTGHFLFPRDHWRSGDLITIIFFQGWA